MTAEISTSLIEGLYLMVVGMSFVLGFLTLVVISLKILAKVAPVEEPPEPKSATPRQVKDKKLMAAISSAVHQYRQDNNSRK